MIIEPTHPDVMKTLIHLAHIRTKDREAARARFNAAFSACSGMAKDYPDLAIHWLEALKTDQNWRRTARINALIRNIISKETALRQPVLF